VIGRHQVTYFVKRVAARLLYAVGLLHVWQSIVLRRRAVVLMYHRVLTPDERRAAGSHPALIVDRDTFARQMAFVKRHFTVLSIAQFAAHVEHRRPFPPSSCIITFDDGWRDNYANAVPILAGLRLPSLIFLPMNYIGQPRVFWQEALVQLLGCAIALVRQHADRRPAIDALLAPVGLSAVLDIADAEPKPELIAVVTMQKHLTRERVERLVADLAMTLEVSQQQLSVADGFINWQQVEEMRRRGVSFGGHGIDHLLLTHVDEATVEAEVTGSKHELDARLGELVPTFSYPNGYCTPGVAATVRNAGYKLAFIAQGGPVTCDDDPWTLRRVNIHQNSDTEPLFLARLLGLF